MYRLGNLISILPCRGNLLGERETVCVCVGGLWGLGR